VLAHPHRPTLVPSPSNGRRVWCTGDSPATPLVSSRCQRLAVAVAHGEQRGGCYGRGRVVMRVMRLWRLAEHARRGRHGLLTPWTSTMRRRRASISKPPLACIANEAPHASSNTPQTFSHDHSRPSNALPHHAHPWPWPPSLCWGEDRPRHQVDFVCSTSKTRTRLSGPYAASSTLRPRALTSPFAKCSEAGTLGVRGMSRVAGPFAYTNGRPAFQRRRETTKTTRCVVPLTLLCPTRPATSELGSSSLHGWPSP
jgi:hypothetical protein